LIKIQNFFSRMCWRRMFCFSVHSPWEKNLKSFPFKMVLSWKQCSCDVIIERVYCRTTGSIPARGPIVAIFCNCSWFNRSNKCIQIPLEISSNYKSL
jgi:hypothetical protein